MPRQRSSDLFPTDQPIPASQMIGREPDIREVTATLAGGSSVVIAGPRRTGQDERLRRGARPARQAQASTSSRVDLFRIATAGELAEALVAQSISNRSTLRRVLHQTRRAGRFVADVAHTSAVVKSKAQLGEEIEIAFQPGLAAARAPSATSTTRSSCPGRIAAADRKQAVVFFDEFQEIASPQQPYGDPDRVTKRDARDLPALLAA